jgi:hypothetical protein
LVISLPICFNLGLALFLLLLLLLLLHDGNTSCDQCDHRCELIIIIIIMSVIRQDPALFRFAWHDILTPSVILQPPPYRYKFCSSTTTGWFATFFVIYFIFCQIYSNQISFKNVSPSLCAFNLLCNFEPVKIKVKLSLCLTN